MQDIVQWDYGSWPDGLPTKDGANALSGAGLLDTATTCLSKTSRTKNSIIEYGGLGACNAGGAHRWAGGSSHDGRTRETTHALEDSFARARSDWPRPRPPSAIVGDASRAHRLSV